MLFRDTGSWTPLSTRPSITNPLCCHPIKDATSAISDSIGSRDDHMIPLWYHPIHELFSAQQYQQLHRNTNTHVTRYHSKMSVSRLPLKDVDGGITANDTPITVICAPLSHDIDHWVLVNAYQPATRCFGFWRSMTHSSIINAWTESTFQRLLTQHCHTTSGNIARPEATCAQTRRHCVTTVWTCREIPRYPMIYICHWTICIVHHDPPSLLNCG